MEDLQKQIEDLINRNCAENESNTPDFILAEYLLDCLRTWNNTTKKRDKWYSVNLEPGNSSFACCTDSDKAVKNAHHEEVH